MTCLTLRAFAVWILLLGVAVLNGLLRQSVLVPLCGEPAAHVVSTVLLSAVIFGIGWATVGWLDFAFAFEAWAVGLLWCFLTVGFEFSAGHFMFGKPWSVLLDDYNLAAGRIWPLVLLATLVTPRCVLRSHR